jgi:hypothetical protein
MEAFKLLEKLSYYDDADIEVVSINDATYALKSLISEIKEIMNSQGTPEEVLINIKKFINGR